MRLFAAAWPPPDVLDHLGLALEEVVSDGGGRPPIRRVARESWHVTLAFYGEVSEGAVPELTDRLGEVAAATAPMFVELAGAGVFHHSALWLGVRVAESAPADLGDLMARCEQAGAEVSRLPRRERHRAHLTVARARRDGRTVRARDRSRTARGRAGTPGGPDAASALGLMTRALAVYRGPSWPLDEVALVRSDLGAGRGGGPLYETIGRFPLRAQGPAWT